MRSSRVPSGADFSAAWVSLGLSANTKHNLKHSTHFYTVAKMMNTPSKAIRINVEYHAGLSGESFKVTILGRSPDRIAEDGYMKPYPIPEFPEHLRSHLRSVEHGPYVSPEGSPDAGDPLACEIALESWIDSTLIPQIAEWLNTNQEWADANIEAPKFGKWHNTVAKDVASRGPRLDSDVDLIQRNFVEHARLLLLGDFETLSRVCQDLRGVLEQESGAEFRGSLMTRDSANALNAEGTSDAFHFVAAVPVEALRLLLEKDDAEAMRTALLNSGVNVGVNTLELSGAAFPGKKKKCEVRWLRGDDVALADIATLENGGEVHVLVCGYDDSTHPDERLREPKFTINFPGGKRWVGESGVDCALREVLEETRLALRPVGWTCPATELVHHVVEGVRFNYAFGPYHVVASLPDEHGAYPAFAVRPAIAPNHTVGEGRVGRGRGAGSRTGRGAGSGRGRGGSGKGRGGSGKGRRHNSPVCVAQEHRRGGFGKGPQNNSPPRSEHGGVATCRYFLQGTCRNGSSCQFRHTGA